jgi:hypothetical protein
MRERALGVLKPLHILMHGFFEKPDALYRKKWKNSDAAFLLILSLWESDGRSGDGQ